jgi:hypothetical protein
MVVAASQKCLRRRVILATTKEAAFKLSDGGSLLLLLGSGVVRCILVTVEKNAASQLKSIARTHCRAGDLSLK